MKKQNPKTMKTWLLWNPLKFVLYSCLISLIIMAIFSLAFPESGPVLSMLIMLGFMIAMGITFWQIPRDNLDQRSFVALTNAQIVIGALLLAAFAAFITFHYDWILLKIMWLDTHSKSSLALVLIISFILLLYIIGLYGTSIYLKYRRCRTMGIRPWKIICSMPLGFALLWAPGYILSDLHNPTPLVQIRPKWYSKFTNWLIMRPLSICISFIVIISCSRMFVGPDLTITTIALTTLFAIWLAVVGKKKFRANIGDKYATFAVIVNIILLITFAIVISQPPQPIPMITH